MSEQDTAAWPFPPTPQEGHGPLRPGNLAVAGRVKSVVLQQAPLGYTLTPGSLSMLSLCRICSLLGPDLSFPKSVFPVGISASLQVRTYAPKGGRLSLKFSKGGK